MFTKWQHIEDWIRDNSLSSWRFQYDKSGNQTADDGTVQQNRSNRIILYSDCFPGDLEEKIRLTKKRLATETNCMFYGVGKRGKENTGMLYCEVRLDEYEQRPGIAPVSSPLPQPVDEDAIAARIRKEIQAEMQLQRYEDERKQFERERKEFEDAKNSAIGMLVHYLSPVLSALGQKRVAGVDAQAPVHAAPVQTLTTDTQEEMEELFTEKESDALFELMARFKQVEPQYLELIEKVVIMAESGDATYGMAKSMLLK